MNNSRNTKRSLLVAVLSLVLCLSMLIGTTFAWFTDSVTSGNNQIAAGNLDAEVYDGNGNKVTSETKFFDDILWEPGAVAYENIKVANEGTLAFMYQLSLHVGNYNTVKDTTKSLKDVLKIAVVEKQIEASADRAAVLNSVREGKFTTLQTWQEEDELYPVGNKDGFDTNHEYAIVLYWEPSAVDNEYNINNGKETSDGEPLYVDLGLNLFATQLTYENDSFNNQYDVNALVKVTDEATLRAAYAEAAEGAVLMFSNDIEMASELEIKKDVVFYLAGHTFSGANLAIDDANITLQAGEATGIDVSGNGTLTLECVNVKAADNDSAIALAEGATINVAVKGSATVIGGKNGDGIEVPAEATLTLSGKNLTAIGNAGKEYAVDENEVFKNTEDKAYLGTAGNGIGGNSATIEIKDMKNLTAKGFGTNASGIVGAKVTISDSEIAYACGGCVRNVPSEAYLDYAKKGNGGVGIGVTNGGTLKMTNTAVNGAAGGAKSAAIGGTWWSNVTVEISECTLKNIVGGYTAAGIGGGRANNDKAASGTVTLTIEKSEISNVTGGYFAAGIGSGYDSACSGIPTTTINIKGSTLTNIKGGLRGAGIGTGYHNPKLDGSIDSSEGWEKIEAGDSDKNGYTVAQNIGYGVTDVNNTGRGYASYAAETMLKESVDRFTVGTEKINVPTIK